MSARARRAARIASRPIALATGRVCPARETAYAVQPSNSSSSPR